MRRLIKRKGSKILSVMMSFLMVITMIPLEVFADDIHGTITSNQIQEAEEIRSKIEGYYLSLEKGDSGKPRIDTSLSAFALKSAGIDVEQFEIAADDSVYSYENRFGTMSSSSYENNKSWAEVAELTDQIFDYIALEKDASDLVEQLLAKQNDEGWFDSSKNSACQAKAIMAIDAYFGKDYDEEWLNYDSETGRGRIGALKALVNSQYFMGGNANGSFSGKLFIPRIYNSKLGPFNVIASSADRATAVVVTALSNYKDCSEDVVIDGKEVELGAAIEQAIETSYEYAKNPDNNIFKIGASSSIASYYIPALISDGQISYISEYELINSLKNNQKENGSFESQNQEEALAINVETQQVLIAVGDLIYGQNSYTRIKSPRAATVEKLAEAADNINVPSSIEVNPDTLQSDGTSIVLPDSAGDNISITWSSSNQDIISDDGLVTFPQNKTETVELTAHLELLYDVDRDSVKKDKTFTVNVKSKVLGKAAEQLKNRLEFLSSNYGNDISQLGFNGVEALASSGERLNDYEVCGLSNEENAEAYAKNVLQIVLTGNNPYDYNDKNYVEILKSASGSFDGNPWVLAALDSCGEYADDAFISGVAVKAVTGTSISLRSTAVNSLASHFESGSTTSAAIICTSPSAITMAEIEENFYDFAESIQKSDGIFGNNTEDHSSVIGALISLGEDVFSSKYTKDDNTVLDAVNDESYSDLYVIKGLGDIISGNSLFERTRLTKSDLNILINSAEIMFETGTGKYSAGTLQVLKDALLSAKDAEDDNFFGKAYFELKEAISNLSINMLPEFTDLHGYNDEEILKFKEGAENLYNLLKQTQAAVEDVNNIAENVVSSYSQLRANSPMPLNRTLLQISDISADGIVLVQSSSQEDTKPDAHNQASEILEKTAEAYDESTNYDLSGRTYWGVFEAAAMGKDLTRYKAYDVTKHKNGMFLTYQATDYAAIILQLILTGENPYDFNGTNYVERLQEIGIKNQGIFGPYANNIWALLALDAAGAEYNPAVIYAVAGQAASETFDLDMRGWALIAAANHKDIQRVEDSIQSALTNIETMQIKEGQSAGCFKHLNYTNNNINTHSCVVSGLVAAGEDLTSQRWTKNGQSPLDVIKSYQLNDGRFYYCYDENGELQNPSFNKDAIIALGDAAQGSNVWQRAYLDREKVDKAIAEGKAALSDASYDVPQYKKDALQAALDNAEAITEISGNGQKYFRLLEAVKELKSVDLPKFTDEDDYTFETYSSFENAVKNAALVLLQVKAKASDLNDACINVVSAYDSLEKVKNPGEDDPSNHIKVTFKLLGAKKHGGTGTAQTLRYGNLQTWIPKTTVEVAENSTVYDVFTRVLDGKGYKYVGADNNYVSTIITPEGETLSELDNGNDSGWMYAVNGKHPQIGLKDYTLDEGDDIIWHYTDDYTVEEGSEKWNDKDSQTTTGSSGVVLKIQSKKDEKGIAAASLTSGEAKSLADEIGKLENKEGISAKIEIKLPEDSEGLRVEVPEGILKALKEKDNLSLEISSDTWSASIDAKALQNIIDQYGTNSLEISFTKAEIENMTEETKNLIGDRMVYDIKIYSNRQCVKNFGGGSVICGIPYDAEGEDAGSLTVYRIKDDGTVEIIEDSSYDEELKAFKFKVYSLSNFAVGYRNLINFIDVDESHWAYDYITRLAQRGIINGKSENEFAPEDSITRAEFTSILARMSGDDLYLYKASKFKDVNSGDWFMASAAWAAENKISQGYDSRFNPYTGISRQDMAVMLMRYAKNIVEKDLAEKQGKVLFIDDSQIDEYAREAVYSMAQYGVIGGRENKTFDPKAPATRAEAAKMIDIILNLLKE